MELEFTNDTLVITEQGVERLTDLLRRPVKPSLWAVKWVTDSKVVGISFHRSHREAKKFADVQVGAKPSGPARLVCVSPSIMECIRAKGYCCTTLTDFAEAENHTS